MSRPNSIRTMGWANAKLSAYPHDLSRIVTLLGSILVALGSGTNYIYSAYAPQLGARLRISHTQLNIIGLAGNMGVYTSGPVWGRIIDRDGPRVPLICAAICLSIGYIGIKQMYADGIGSGTTVSSLHLVLLVFCSILTGLGSNAGFGAAMNTTAKSFPSSARATTTALVLSGFGLSAFWFSLLARTFFPGDTSAFLLILAVGTSIPMIIGLFVVKPVPPQQTSAYSTIEGYHSIQSEDGIAFVGEQRMMGDLEPCAEVETDSASLLSHQQEPDPCPVSVSPSAVESNPPVDSHDEGNVGDNDELPDIHGKQLWLAPDFHLVFLIMTICSGTGLMWINNVGSMAQALYAKTHAVYDDVEASKWQVAQVSTLSLGNFAGRILIGLISDFAYTRLHLPRAYCLCIVSSLFIISQATAMIVSSVETLWIATVLLGVAYGSLFGCYPTIVIEWFGLTHFAENWGYVSFSPALGGNFFSLMFGLYLDAHAPAQDTRSSLVMRTLSSFSLRSRGLPSEHQCFDGKACYLGSLQVTLAACTISLGLSWYAGIRDGQKIREEEQRERSERCDDDWGTSY